MIDKKIEYIKYENKEENKKTHVIMTMRNFRIAIIEFILIGFVIGFIITGLLY